MNTMKMRWCAAAVLAAAGHAQAVDKSWNALSGNWNTGGNWFTPGVPGVADNVFIGNTAAATNAWVTLNVNPTVASLSITDGMTLDTDSGRIIVNGPTQISGSNLSNGVRYRSRIAVENGPFGTDFQTDSLTLADEAYVDMNGGTLRIQNSMDFPAGTILDGDGVVNYAGASTFRINGSLDPGTGGLHINQIGTGRIDLDGSIDDNSAISAATFRADGTGFSNLTVTGDQLVDTYDERFRIIGNGFIEIRMTNGWSMGASSAVEFIANSSFPGPASLNGTALTFGGSITMPGAESRGAVLAPIVLQPSASVVVGSGDRLDFDGATTINGGTYDCDVSGQLNFDGPTTVTGGTFICGNPGVGLATSVDFNGPTTWNGAVTISGVASQDGDAHVTGPTTITADVFDLDGFSGQASWTIDQPLVLNVGYSDNQFGNVNAFDGNMTIGGALNALLTVNLGQPSTQWRMAGTMNVSTVGNLHITKISGSPVYITGAMNLTGAPRFTANTWIGGTSTTTFTTPTSSLRLTGESRVSSVAAFAGGGTVVSTSTGSIVLNDGASLGTTSLTVEGGFRVGDGVGGASVHRYVQNAGATWNVQIGGNAPGVSHDILIASGAGAAINGNVEVELDGPFIPAVGQTFLFLSTIHGVTGTFVNDPVTNTGNVRVEWSYVYTGDSVMLRADNVVFVCPADFNGDGFLDFFDYDDFVKCFETGVCPAGKNADYNRDGFVDFFDYDDFVRAFENGC